MFGLFRKKQPVVHKRKDMEIGEMRDTAFGTFLKFQELDPSLQIIADDNKDAGLITLSYHGIEIQAPYISNLSGLEITTIIPECNIKKASTIEEKAFAYRCIDHTCFKAPGVRAFFHPETGELVVGVRSAGFEEQYRADTLIDIALFMLEDGVHKAKTYLGLPTTEPEPVRVSQWDGGYHFGKGFKTYQNAKEAFAVYMISQEQCQEVSRDGNSILLESGPIQYDIRGFGWPNGYMITTATRGFKHIYKDDERYVRVQERLAEPIFNPEREDARGRHFRSEKDCTIAYFQDDGTFVLGQYGFGNPKTDENGKAFDSVSGAHMVNVYHMTYLAEELPEELYSDEQNRPN